MNCIVPMILFSAIRERSVLLHERAFGVNIGLSNNLTYDGVFHLWNL